MNYELDSARIVGEPMVRLITPEIAEKFLANNLINRKLNRTKIHQFSEMIKEGQWQLTHQGIAITKDEALIDGQHRMYAIIKAETPCKMYVTVFDTNATALRLAFDMGIPRPHHIVLNVDEFKSRIAKIIGRVLLGDTGILTFEKIFTGLENELNWFFDPPHVHKKVKIFSSNAIMAVVVIRKAMGIDWYDQWTAMCDARMADQNFVSRLLVNYLGKMQGSKGIVPERIAFVAAWKASDPERQDMTKISIRQVGPSLEEARRWLIVERDVR